MRKSPGLNIQKKTEQSKKLLKQKDFKQFITNTFYPILQYTQKLKLLHKINILLGIRNLLTTVSFWQRELHFSLSAS